MSPATYAAAVAAVNASRQATAIQPPPPSSSQPPISVTRGGEDSVSPASSRKREAPGDKDAQAVSSSCLVVIEFLQNLHLCALPMTLP